MDSRFDIKNINLTAFVTTVLGAYLAGTKIPPQFGWENPKMLGFCGIFCAILSGIAFLIPSQKSPSKKVADAISNNLDDANRAAEQAVVDAADTTVPMAVPAAPVAQAPAPFPLPPAPLTPDEIQAVRDALLTHRSGA